jgi:hypothetical protein
MVIKYESVLANPKYIHSKKCHVVENRLEQRFAAHIVHSCQQY